MERTELNIATGDVRVVPFTQDEIDAITAIVPGKGQSLVPQEVTRFQALAALHTAGLLSPVKTMMADPATDPLTVLAFDNALTFKRGSPMVLNIAQALGLSDQQLDDLFIAAIAIE